MNLTPVCLTTTSVLATSGTSFRSPFIQNAPFSTQETVLAGREGKPEAPPMGAHDHLRLRALALESHAHWAERRPGLHFVFPGEGPGGMYLSGTLSQPLAQGDVLIVNGLNEGKICARDGNAFSFRTFSLLIEHLFPLFAGSEITLLQPLTRRLKTWIFYPGASPLARECQQLVLQVPKTFNLEHRGQLLVLTTTILSHEFHAMRQHSGEVSPSDKGVAQIMQFFRSLSANQLLELSVDELATQFRCSRRQLNRVFHRYFKVSVATLKMEMRLLKAISLLRNPEAKIVNVATECGFRHLGFFNACFRKRFGQSPSQWRTASGVLASQRHRQSE